jgi:hypothetical protein
MLARMLAREHIFSLHLPLRRLPFRARVMRIEFFKDQEMLTAKGFISRVEKDAGAQIDAPPFGGMLHIGIRLFWIKGEMFGSP